MPPIFRRHHVHSHSRHAHAPGLVALSFFLLMLHAAVRRPWRMMIFALAEHCCWAWGLSGHYPHGHLSTRQVAHGEGRRRDLTLDRVKVIYGNDRSKTLHFGRNLKEGQESGWKSLGNRLCIKKIEVYGNSSGARPASRSMAGSSGQGRGEDHKTRWSVLSSTLFMSWKWLISWGGTADDRLVALEIGPSIESMR